MYLAAAKLQGAPIIGCRVAMDGRRARISPPLTDFFTALPFHNIEEIAGVVCRQPAGFDG